jgi:hypothetical protein
MTGAGRLVVKSFSSLSHYWKYCFFLENEYYLKIQAHTQRCWNYRKAKHFLTIKTSLQTTINWDYNSLWSSVLPSRGHTGSGGLLWRTLTWQQFSFLATCYTFYWATYWMYPEMPYKSHQKYKMKSKAPACNWILVNKIAAMVNICSCFLVLASLGEGGH